MRWVKFTKVGHPTKYIEVPTKAGKIEVDNRGFVHLRSSYNGYRMIPENVLMEQFESTEKIG